MITDKPATPQVPHLSQSHRAIRTKLEIRFKNTLNMVTSYTCSTDGSLGYPVRLTLAIFRYVVRREASSRESRARRRYRTHLLSDYPALRPINCSAISSRASPRKSAGDPPRQFTARSAVFAARTGRLQIRFDAGHHGGADHRRSDAHTTEFEPAGLKFQTDPTQLKGGGNPGEFVSSEKPKSHSRGITRPARKRRAAPAGARHRRGRARRASPTARCT